MEVTALATAVMTLAAENSLEALSNRIVQLALQYCAVDRAIVWITHQGKRYHSAQDPVPATLMADTLRRGTVHRSPPQATDPYFATHHPAGFAVVPLPTSLAQTAGALYVEYATPGADDSERDDTVLAIAQTAGVVLAHMAAKLDMQTDAVTHRPPGLDARMVSSFAHVIRNALTSATFCFEALRLTLDDPSNPSGSEVREALEGARRGVDRSLRVTARISEYAHAMRICGPHRHATPVARSVQSLLFRLAGELKAAQVTVDQQAVRPIYINMSDAHLQALLGHFITNAHDALLTLPPPHPRRISLSADAEGSAGVIIIADNGPGFSEEAESRMFEPFFTTRGPSGTGMGMVVARKLAEAYGGDVTVDSIRGAGTNVRLHLPLAPA